jgi:hypothetical protein
MDFKDTFLRWLLENLKKGYDLVHLTVDIRIILKWTSKILLLGDFWKTSRKDMTWYT